MGFRVEARRAAKWAMLGAEGEAPADAAARHALPNRAGALSRCFCSVFRERNRRFCVYVFIAARDALPNRAGALSRCFCCVFRERNGKICRCVFIAAPKFSIRRARASSLSWTVNATADSAFTSLLPRPSLACIARANRQWP